MLQAALKLLQTGPRKQTADSDRHARSSQRGTNAGLEKKSDHETDRAPNTARLSGGEYSLRENITELDFLTAVNKSWPMRRRRAGVGALGTSLFRRRLIPGWSR